MSWKIRKFFCCETQIRKKWSIVAGGVKNDSNSICLVAVAFLSIILYERRLPKTNVVKCFGITFLAKFNFCYKKIYNLAFYSLLRSHHEFRFPKLENYLAKQKLDRDAWWAFYTMKWVLQKNFSPPLNIKNVWLATKKFCFKKRKYS